MRSCLIEQTCPLYLRDEAHLEDHRDNHHYGKNLRGGF
jgi:hypothetical protein